MSCEKRFQSDVVTLQPLKDKDKPSIQVKLQKNTKIFPERAQRSSLNIPNESGYTPDWKSDEAKIQQISAWEERQGEGAS